MIEVLWHGRGGQGAFTAARLLGAAASLAEGAHALAFPSFGPERRGAPMRAFTKLSDRPIGDRSAIVRADYVVYLDDTLLGEGWDRELKANGVVLVNSTRTFADDRIVSLDADGISAAVLGRPIPNTAFLGALSVLCDRIGLDDVKQAIRQYMPKKLHEKNIAIVEAAREALAGAAAASPRTPQGLAAGASDPVAFDSGCAAAPAARVEGALGAASRKDGVRIPALRDGALDPAEFAHTTCFEAGYLVAKNAGWRNMRPVIDAGACTGCLQCYLYCPDGAVYKAPSDSQPAARVDVAASAAVRADVDNRATVPVQSAVAVDYDFCKGCGVCVTVCRFGAIAMVAERGESEGGVR